MGDVGRGEGTVQEKVAMIFPSFYGHPSLDIYCTEMWCLLYCNQLLRVIGAFTDVKYDRTSEGRKESHPHTLAEVQVRKYTTKWRETVKKNVL